MNRMRYIAAAGVTLVAAAGMLTACSSSSGGGSTGASTGGSGESKTVTFQLDWTPNTDHTGLYVAQEKGYFADAGIDVQIQPYTDTYPDVLVGQGTADCGIGFQDSSTIAMASGSALTAVMAPIQHWISALGVKADNTAVNSPKDLDGKIYAGFGGAGELAEVKAVIQADGGTGDFQNTMLGTSAYDAVWSGQADFTAPFKTWEGIEAELIGEPFKYFDYTDYGFPDEYGLLVNCNSDWLKANPDTAKAFVQALAKGYQYGIDNPDDAAQILVAANPDTFSTDTLKELASKSQEELAKNYMLDADGKFGLMTDEQWNGLGKFLYDSGLLVDEGGSALTSQPDFSTFYTNEYLQG